MCWIDNNERFYIGSEVCKKNQLIKLLANEFFHIFFHKCLETIIIKKADSIRFRLFIVKSINQCHTSQITEVDDIFNGDDEKYKALTVTNDSVFCK